MAQGPDGDGQTPQPERQRRDRGGMGERWGGRMNDQLEQLKEQLGLDDEQVKRLEELTTPMRDGLFDEMRRLREGGGEFNWEDMRERMRGFRDQLNETIGSVLTDEQKKKFEEMLANPDRGRRGRRGRDPERDRQRRLDDAKKALIMTPEEEEVLVPMIEAVVNAQNTLRSSNDTQRREFTEFLRSGLPTEAITARLTEFREQRGEAETVLETARASLQEVLTLEQEAKLVALGILR